MRALQSIKVGGPQQLALNQVPKPVPGPGEIRIEVAACGLNYPDILIIEDRYQTKLKRPFTPGFEVSGIVDAVGPSVTDFAPAQRVMASLPGGGGLAEFAIARVNEASQMPPGMPFEHGAALLTTHLTSLYALEDRAALLPGETLLVMGASGGVGLAAVEIGRAMGAVVVAGASSAAKLAVAIARGAHHGFVYPANVHDPKQLAATIKSELGERGADVIFDPLGGAYAVPALRAIAWKGRYLVIGYVAGIPNMPLNLPLLKGCQIVGVFLGSGAQHDPDLQQALLKRLLTLYSSGALSPVVSHRFPLDRGGAGLALLASRKSVGKIIIDVAK